MACQPFFLFLYIITTVQLKKLSKFDHLQMSSVKETLYRMDI